MFNNIVFQQGAAVAADFNGTAFNFKGGRIVLGGFGTFGGGTLKVQYSPDDPTGATWLDLGAQNGAATQITAGGTVMFYLPPGRYRAAFAGSVAPTLYWWIGEASD